jgi:adenosylcobinamide kinase/adenosylcobinamide-phosphate guanylyltransferase
MALVVFTGGARSGKSSAAQRLGLAGAAEGQSVCVAVFGRESVDAEFARRVAAHRRSRPATWTTIEAADPIDWTRRVPGEALLIIDCVGTLLGLAMETAHDALVHGGLDDTGSSELPEGFYDATVALFDPAIEWITRRGADTIVVTNEVGDGVVPTYPSGRLFRDVLGRANRSLVEYADRSYLCVASRLVCLTDLPRDAQWPTD